jgi:FAD/FMN-containing dehydrogenase
VENLFSVSTYTLGRLPEVLCRARNAEMDLKGLRTRIQGKVTAASHAGYEALRRGMIWNQLTPTRYPRVVVQVAHESDVIETVRFAPTQNMKIAVRVGGYRWVVFPLCDGSLSIDLGRGGEGIPF